jgi:hypothetical protein
MKHDRAGHFLDHAEPKEVRRQSPSSWRRWTDAQLGVNRYRSQEEKTG